MTKINRAKLRGSALDGECRKAHTSPHEYGPEDGRVFCHGLIDMMTDEPPKKCRMCGAYTGNATPPKE